MTKENKKKKKKKKRRNKRRNNSSSLKNLGEGKIASPVIGLKHEFHHVDQTTRGRQLCKNLMGICFIIL